MKITKKQFEKMILQEADKIKNPLEAQKEQAEEDKYSKIEQLQELGEKIHGQINNSFEHLNAFLSLGLKTRDSFEYKRAVAEIQRILKLTGDMAKVISRAHKTAEAEPEIQESPYDSAQMAQMAAGRQPKPSPASMGMQESLRNKYGVILEHFGSIKNVDVKAKNASQALLIVRKYNPAWSVKRIIMLESGMGRLAMDIEDAAHTVGKDPKKIARFIKTSGGDYFAYKNVPIDFLEKAAKDWLANSQTAVSKDYAELINKTPGQGARDWYDEAVVDNPLALRKDVLEYSDDDDDAELINKAPGQRAKDWYEEADAPKPEKITKIEPIKKKRPYTVALQQAHDDEDDAELVNKAPGQRAKDWYEEEASIREQWKGWNEQMPVQLVGVKGGKITPDGSGVQMFPNLAVAKKVFPELDPVHGCEKFTWAMHGSINGKDAIRFETWQAEKHYGT